MNTFSEETILFFSVLKWVFLATLAGVIVGAATSLFLQVLYAAIGWTASFPLYFLALPLAMLASVLIIERLAPDAAGHGTEKVIEAVHKKAGKIKAAVVPVKLVTTVLTLAFGGSVGREGPAAQIGAGLMSAFSGLFKFDSHDQKKLVICGISAGFAAVFGTPIAGAIFGVEVLFVGGLMYDVLLPSFIAGIVAYETSVQLGIHYAYTSVGAIPAFSENIFLTVIAAGLFFGAVSWLFIESVEKIEEFWKKLPQSMAFKALVAGVLMVAASAVVGSSYFGLSTSLLDSSLKGDAVPWYSFLLKTAFTATSLGAGGSGGILTPIFVVGATAGNAFAHLIGANVLVLSAIGFVAVLAGTTNAPIAASIMSIELFGPSLAPYAAIACIISFLITGHRSVYPAQVFAMSKSASLQIKKDDDGGFHTVAAPKDPKMAKLYEKTAGKIKSSLIRIHKKKPVNSK